MFTNPFNNTFYGSPYGVNNSFISIPQQKAPKSEIPNVLQFKADVSGCSFYRMQMSETILNYTGKANISSFNKIVLHDNSEKFFNVNNNFFNDINVVRVQRLTSPAHLKYLQYLKNMQQKYGFRIIYEIDDMPLIEYIPKYNVAHAIYNNKEIQDSIKQIMNLCDEITVTTPYMKKLFSKHLDNQKITVLPNFQARWWMNGDLLYNQAKINADYDKNKGKPRILYCGSNAHYDIANSGHLDDTAHIIEAIINSVNDYQWVFLGGYPKQLKSWVETKKIEYHPWSKLTEYPMTLFNLNIQAAIAPLIDNDFNRCKSNIKFTEMLHYGIPVICQDMETYKDAWFKFKTGEELIHQLNEHVKRAGHYKNLGVKLYKESKKWVLDNPENIGLYEELYKYPYGSPERKLLAKYNED